MNHNFWDEVKVRAILDCESNQVRDIISAAGFSPRTFLKYADLRGVDLRNQDLRGIELDGAWVAGALVNESTLFDEGRAIITDKEKLSDVLISSIDHAEEFFDYHRLAADCRQIFGQALRFTTFLGEELDIRQTLTALSGEGGPVHRFLTQRGYIYRNVLVVELEEEGGDKALDEAIHKITRQFPSVIDEGLPDTKRYRQIELPLSLEHVRPVSRLGGNILRGRLGRIVQGLKRHEGVTDVWLMMKSEPKSLRYLMDLLRVHQRIRLFYQTSSQSAANTADDDARTRRLPRASLVAANYWRRGAVGRLAHIERAHPKEIKFSNGVYDAGKGKLKDWDHLRPLLVDALKISASRAKYLPVTVGLRELQIAQKVAMLVIQHQNFDTRMP